MIRVCPWCGKVYIPEDVKIIRETWVFPTSKICPGCLKAEREKLRSMGLLVPEVPETAEAMA